MSPRLLLVFFVIYLSAVQARRGHSINQDVQQNVEGKSCGPINQKIDQYVNVKGKTCPRPSTKSSGINQNVGQVVSSSGSCSDSEVNQRVHQRVGQEDPISDSSQSEDASSEEIIFKRHHCRNDDSSKADSSSEEITIHRGCHGSEYTRKKHSDDDSASEELIVDRGSEKRKINEKPKRKPKTCRKKYVVEPKTKCVRNEMESEETWDTSEVYGSDENRSLKAITESSESTEQSEGSSRSDGSAQTDGSSDETVPNKFCPHCGQNWSCGCK